MKKISLLTLVGLSLTACVSGGYFTSDTSRQQGYTSNSIANQSVTQNDQYPVESVMIHLLEDYGTELSATYDQTPIKLKLETFKKGEALFEGMPVLKSEIDTDFYMAGEYVMSTNFQNFYSLNPLVFYGDILDDGTYTIAKQLSNIPKQAKIGDTSIYSQQITYKDSSKHKQVSSTTLAWSVTKATDNTAWLCMTAKSHATTSEYDYSGNECYEITNTGDILRAKIEAPSTFDEGKTNMQFLSN